jgi:hypothetical protein
MNDTTHIYNRWQGYTSDDCACEYCLYFDEAEKICCIDICCCLEEKQEAFVRLHRNGMSRTKQCPV